MDEVGGAKELDHSPPGLRHPTTAGSGTKVTFPPPPWHANDPRGTTRARPSRWGSPPASKHKRGSGERVRAEGTRERRRSGER